MKKLFYFMIFILQFSMINVPKAFPQVPGDYSSSFFNGTWSITGQAGFSADTASSCELKIHPSGMPWVAYWTWGSPYSHSYTNVMAFSGSSWSSVGPDSISDGYFVSLAFSSSGIPYVAFAEDCFPSGGQNKASVKSFDGTAWNYVGNRYFSQGECWHIRIAMSPADQPYVAIQDVAHNSGLSVMKYDGNSWVYVGTPGISNTYGRSPFIAFNPATGEPWVTSQAGKVWRFDGTTWNLVGNGLYTQNWIDSISMAFTPSGQAYIAYCDGGNGWKATVKTFDGSQWVDVGIHGISAGAAGYTSIAINPAGMPVVGFQDSANGNKASVLAFDGTQWVSLGQQGISAGEVTYTTIAFAPTGVLYLAYCDWSNFGRVTVLEFNGYLGVREIQQEKISLYPNPVSNNLTLQIRNSDNSSKTIQIFNPQGKEILKTNTSNNNVIFDMTSYSPGMYCIHVSSGELTYSSKFVKN